MLDPELARNALLRPKGGPLRIIFWATLLFCGLGAIAAVSGWVQGSTTLGSCLSSGTFVKDVNGESSLEPLALPHLVFGIAGATKMWAERSEELRLWWRKDEMRGYIFLDEPVEDMLKFDDLPQVRLSCSLDNFTHVPPVPFDRHLHIRVARVLIETYWALMDDLAKSGNKKHWHEPRWFVGGDDDTIFSTDNLVDLLARYDHREMHYIGGRSESHTNQALFGYNMAFGGGGYAISWPLMQELSKSFDGCLERYAELWTADQRVATCAGELGVQVTHELGFHQLDLRGDVSGLLMRHPQVPLVSLHHLGHLEPIFPDMTRLDAAKRLLQGLQEDPAGFLQQAMCWDRKRDATYVIGAGFAVKVYGGIRRIGDLTMRTEMTFGSHFVTEHPNKPEHFTFDVHPMEPLSKPCGTPYVLYTGGTTTLKEGVVETTYYRKDTPPQICDPLSERITAIRVRSEPSPLKTLRSDLKPGHWGPWGRNLRKMCCQSIEALDPGGRSLAIHIGKCEQGQLVSEPR